MTVIDDTLDAFAGNLPPNMPLSMRVNCAQVDPVARALLHEVALEAQAIRTIYGEHIGVSAGDPSDDYAAGAANAYGVCAISLARCFERCWKVSGAK